MKHQNIYVNLKKTIFLVLFTFSFHWILAQQSRINELNKLLLKLKSEDTLRVQILSELSFLYRTTNPDSTIILAQQTYDLSQKLGYIKGKATALKDLAIGNYVVGNYAKATQLNSLALKLHRQLNDKKGEAAVLNNMAIVFQNEGKFSLALSYYKQSLQLRESVNDQKGIADCLNNMGNIYTDIGNYATSLENLFKSLIIRENIKDSIGIANSYANIAGVYYYLKKFDEAFQYAQKAYDIQEMLNDKEGMIQSSVSLGGVSSERKDYTRAHFFFERALNIAQQINNEDGKAVALTNLGEIHNLLNEPNRAIEYFNRALTICSALEDPQGIAICEVGIGRSLFKKNQVKESIIRLLNGYKLASKVHHKLQLFESSKYLAEAYEKDGNTLLQIKFLKESILYKDSLFNEENARKTKEIEFNYLLEKKQNEITILEKDRSIQQARNRFQYLLLIVLLIGIIGLLLFTFYVNKFRVKEKQAKELIIQQKAALEKQAHNLEELNNYKNKTFSILSHDLRNPISSLAQILDLIDHEVLSEEDFGKVKGRFKAQLKSLRLLLDNTLNWSKSQMSGELQANKKMVNVRELVLRNYELFKENAAEKSLKLNIQVPSDLFVLMDPDHLDIILRNAIQNAIKFTFPEGQVDVLAFQKNESITIQIKDNGQGMSTDTLNSLFSYKKQPGIYGTNGERGAGIGLILTKEFVDRNLGQINVKSELNKGTEIEFNFPA
jgi:signal transduction histidine kinase/tetratricopeptide (TPR) repeat protein